MKTPQEAAREYAGCEKAGNGCVHCDEGIYEICPPKVKYNAFLAGDAFGYRRGMAYAQRGDKLPLSSTINEFEKYPELSDQIQLAASIGHCQNWNNLLSAINSALKKCYHQAYRWISVLAGLPEDQDDVLVLFCNGRKGIGSYVGNNEWAVVIASEYDSQNLKVIAWRPIEPVKE